MGQSSVEDRISYAKKSAKERCRNLGYDVINSDNEIFCFMASIAGIHERKIRVVVDKITEDDITIVKRFRIPSNQTKEIWCRPYGSRNWKTLIFDYLNNLCQ